MDNLSKSPRGGIRKNPQIAVDTEVYTFSATLQLSQMGQIQFSATRQHWYEISNNGVFTVYVYRKLVRRKKGKRVAVLNVLCLFSLKHSHRHANKFSAMGPLSLSLFISHWHVAETHYLPTANLTHKKHFFLLSNGKLFFKT